jgi:hypothetical protein
LVETLQALDGVGVGQKVADGVGVGVGDKQGFVDDGVGEAPGVAVTDGVTDIVGVGVGVTTFTQLQVLLSNQYED